MYLQKMDYVKIEHEIKRASTTNDRGEKINFVEYKEALRLFKEYYEDRIYSINAQDVQYLNREYVVKCEFKTGPHPYTFYGSGASVEIAQISAEKQFLLKMLLVYNSDMDSDVAAIKKPKKSKKNLFSKVESETAPSLKDNQDEAKNWVLQREY